MLSNFHVQTKQKASYFAIAILLISVLFASCVLPSLKLGSASIEMNITIPQYMEKTARIDSSARFIYPDAEKLVVTIEASDMDTETYEFPMKSGVNTISIKNLSPGENRKITVSLHNDDIGETEQSLAEKSKIVDIKMGKNILAFVLAPVHTDGSFDTEGDNLKFELEDNLTGLAEKTQVYAFEIKTAGAYEIKAEFTDSDGNESFAYSLNIYDEAGKKVVKNVDESEDIYTFEEGRYFFVVSIPENADKATFTVKKVEETQTTDFITMLPVPAGSFQRDGTATNISVITEPYYLGKYPITRQQFLDIMGTDPSTTSSSSGMSDPVQQVNWYHAIAFCNKLSLKEGLEPVYTVSVVSNWANLDFSSIPTSSNANWDAAECNWKANGYRLPTEMEWMWAAMGADQDARAGAMQNGINTTGYTKNYAGEGHDTGTSIDDYAWHNNNSGDNGASENRKTHPVGEKLPNELGLYDMSGNVNEWCWDWKADYQTDTLTDYRGADSGSSRVLRGGSWDDSAFFCTVAFQNVGNPYHQDSAGGFRVLRPVQSP